MINAYENRAVFTAKGYTIIEVLIALAIFSIGMMAMGALQTDSLMNAREITDKTQAWAILEDQVETLKSMPFYANDNNFDDDGDGDVDETDELLPGLADSVGGTAFDEPDHARAGGLFEVHWRIVDDVPIAQQANTWTSGPDPITVSKTITVAVTDPGGDPQTDALAMVEFVKTWAEDGIP